MEIPEDRPAPPKREYQSRGDYPAYEARNPAKKFAKRDGGDVRENGDDARRAAPRDFPRRDDAPRPQKFDRFAPRDQRPPAGERGTRPVFGSRDEVSAQSHEPGMVRLAMKSIVPPQSVIRKSARDLVRGLRGKRFKGRKLIVGPAADA